MRIMSIADAAALVRGRRQKLGLSQAELASRARVSRKWINEFEDGGKATAEFGLVIRVLEAVGYELSAEPIPESSSDLDRVLKDLRDV